jgi:hypothetical protein
MFLVAAKLLKNVVARDGIEPPTCPGGTFFTKKVFEFLHFEGLLHVRGAIPHWSRRYQA